MRGAAGMLRRLIYTRYITLPRELVHYNPGLAIALRGFANTSRAT